MHFSPVGEFAQDDVRVEKGSYAEGPGKICFGDIVGEVEVVDFGCAL